MLITWHLLPLHNPSGRCCLGGVSSSDLGSRPPHAPSDPETHLTVHRLLGVFRNVGCLTSDPRRGSLHSVSTSGRRNETRNRSHVALNTRSSTSVHLPRVRARAIPLGGLFVTQLQPGVDRHSSRRMAPDLPATLLATWGAVGY